MQTVVYNAQLKYRANVMHFEHTYPPPSVEIVRQYLFRLQRTVEQLFIR